MLIADQPFYVQKNQKQQVFEPMLQVRSNCLYQFNQCTYDSNPFRSASQLDSAGKLLQQKTYTGMLTPGAKKRLTKAIELMVQASPHKTIYNPVSKRKQPFKLSFVTLTVYSTDRNITSKEAQKTCLERFLRWIRDTHKCHMYIWKAELQKRGQIHYHITLNKFVHWKQIREKWNNLQREAGYLDSYFAKFGHWDANSVDVHSVKKIHDWGGYLMKEFVKTYQNAQSVGGKIWDCSNNLKEAKYFTTTVDYEYSTKISDGIARGAIRPVYTDHCVIFKLIKSKPTDYLNDQDLIEYSSIMAAISNKEIVKETIKEKRPEIIAPLNITGKKTNFVVRTDLFSTS